MTAAISRPADRSPFPDIHLHRARLFFRRKPYPEDWVSPQTDISAARRLIEQCGYGRREEELEAAERAILAQPNARA